MTGAPTPLLAVLLASCARAAPVTIADDPARVGVTNVAPAVEDAPEPDLEPATPPAVPWDERAADVADAATGAGHARALAVARAALAATRGDADAASWLVAHAVVESRLRTDVETCRVGEPHYHGAWQEHDRPDLCRAGIEAQARSAAFRLRQCGPDLARCWGGLRNGERRVLAARMIGGS